MSESHRLERKGEGKFAVYRLEKRVVHTTLIDANGVREVPPDQKAIDLAAALDRHPYFVFAYKERGTFHVDLDIGFQRWIGPQSTRAVCHALRVCGFDEKIIRATIRECKRFERDYMERAVL